MNISPVVIIALTEVFDKPFLQKLYFLFLEILNSKQMVQVSSLSFYLTILRKKKCNFWKNSFIVENFHQMMITTGLLFDDRLRQLNEWKYTLLVKMLHHCFENYPVLSFDPIRPLYICIFLFCNFWFLLCFSYIGVF